MCGIFYFLSCLKKVDYKYLKLSELQAYEYEAFYGTYLSTLDNNVELVEELQKGKNDLIVLMETLPLEKLQHTYGQNKWTVAEVFMHIVDTERIFAYRALRFSRGDKAPLPGFEQDGYVLECNASVRTIDQLMNEYIAVRDSSIALFMPLTGDQLLYTGTAGDLQWSVAGLGFAISGHQKHHVNILKESYL